MASPEDTVNRLNAALVDRYRIKSEIGRGGMATVYLAEDLKHHRDVALKVLQPELSAVVGSERFLAEIETTANLQHPSILPLFDSGEADGLLFYVMPFVDGESLRDKLDREKQVPIMEAVRIATDVAEALQAAHERGVIHRDIKPANILLSRGKPLVADFGIALAVSAAGGGRLTETGLSLGTPHYMSPEQASADRDPSKASDVYSLGCVLYEMLVGEPPFTGPTAQAVFAKVLTEEPTGPTQYRKTIPANVDAAVRRALEKLPADRFASAQDFTRALADPGFRFGEAGAGSSTGAWNRLAVGLGALATLLALTLGWALLRPEAPQPVSRHSIKFGDYGNMGAAWVSPDGSSFLFRESGEEDNLAVIFGPLHLRRRNEVQSTPLPGTEGGWVVAFSPDGGRIAYATFSMNPFSWALRVLSLTGGGTETLIGSGSDTRSMAEGVHQYPLGMEWGPDGYLYLGSYVGGVTRIPDNGGELEEVTVPDTTRGEAIHSFPQLLPDGRTLLLRVNRTLQGAVSPSQIVAVSLETGERTPLVQGVFARYTPTGHLLYVTATGTLMAVQFDPDKLRLSGDPVLLADRVRIEGDDVAFARARPFSLSDEGTLLYRQEVELDDVIPPQPHWLGRTGSGEPVDSLWHQNIGELCISPDGSRVAGSVFDTIQQRSDIWVKVLGPGGLLKLTLEGSSGNPSWTPDGRSVTYSSNRAGNFDIWTEPADNSGPEVLELDLDESVFEPQWSPDGEWLIFRTDTDGPGAGDIMAIRPRTDSSPIALVATIAREVGPRLSPDGRWLAYMSDESGKYEVYVVPFPNTGESRWLVSSNGGGSPVWGKSGEALHYGDDDGNLVTVEVSTSPSFQMGGVSALNVGRVQEGGWGSFFDVSQDGERFLLPNLESPSQFLSGSWILVLNLFEELREKVGI